ncbi:MAG: hypothetical protein WCF90_07150 [Methanomicrobiales archaeon]
MEDRTVLKYSVVGMATCDAIGWLPGLSTTSANGVIALVIGYDKDRRAYILVTNAVNTSLYRACSIICHFKDAQRRYGGVI